MKDQKAQDAKVPTQENPTINEQNESIDNKIKQVNTGLDAVASQFQEKVKEEMKKKNDLESVIERSEQLGNNKIEFKKTTSKSSRHCCSLFGCFGGGRKNKQKDPEKKLLLGYGYSKIQIR